MHTDNFDLLEKENNLLDRLEQAERAAKSIARRNVATTRISNFSVDAGELDYRAIDASGNLRMVMSAVDLYDELGVHAHFAGLDATGTTVEFYISADDGKAYFAGGTAYIDIAGITLRAGAYPATAYLQWVLSTGEQVGSMDGWVDASTSGLELFARAKNSSYKGVLNLGANDYNNVNETVINISQTDIQAIIGMVTAGAANARSATFISNVTATNALNNVMSIVTRSSGTPANGLGTAFSYYIENSANADIQAGYTSMQWVDKTSGSEDASFGIGLMKAGVLTTALTVDPTAGVTMPFGATISAGGMDVTGNITERNVLGFAKSTLTIASDAITVTKTFHDLDTEGGAATDNLSTINGGSTGDLLILKTINSAHDVTIKDGIGNIQCAGDFLMDTNSDMIILLFVGSNWLEIARSNNA